MKRRWLWGMLAVVLLFGAVRFSPAHAAAINGCKHTWVLIDSAEPTCTEDGYNKYRCSRCGKEKTETVEALGHDFSMCVMLSSPTCTEKGVIRCYCSRDESHYEDKYQDALGHDWGEWQTTRAAAWNRDGARKHTCNRCGETEYGVIPARIPRDETLVLFVSPAERLCIRIGPIGADGVTVGFDVVLVNAGDADLVTESYAVTEQSDPVAFEEPQTVPAHGAVKLRIERTVLPSDADGSGAVISVLCVCCRAGSGTETVRSGTVAFVQTATEDPAGAAAEAGFFRGLFLRLTDTEN